MISIDLDPSLNVEPGHQWLVIQNTDEGRALVWLLTGRHPSASLQRGNTLLVPHNAMVDARIVHLIDELAHARYQAPGLVQLTLQETSE